GFVQVCSMEWSQQHGYARTPHMLSWTAARDYCRKDLTDLASVRNEEELQIIQKIAGDFPVWVGAFKDPWEWSDQTYSSFRYWRESEKVRINPDEETCVGLFKSDYGKWGQRPCNEMQPFLCSCE
uniref:C-type lectin domain-containing protein n=1 Tax=Lates calcarifer TaxID=8187 RepID=A0A4W6CHP3_LATCA